MADVSTALLDRRLYQVGDAADLLEVPVSTLSYWLHGLTRSGHDYLPALRQGRNDESHVTWGEFIEAGLLKQLRARGVRLDTIRVFARAVRLALGWSYPLARHDLYVGGDRELVYQAQQIADLPVEAQLLVAGANADYGRGQQVLHFGEPLEAFLEPIEFDGAVPVAYHPARDADLWAITCNPDQRFGSPQVQGIPTDALWELHAAGERIDGIARDFGLDPALVTAAIRYEERRRGDEQAA